MRILSKISAVFGALCLLLLAYSAARSPSGTIAVIGLLTHWWLEPLSPGPAGKEVAHVEIVRNPARQKVAGLAIDSMLTVLFQSEERVPFNGDGHSIVIAGPKGSKEDFANLTSELNWNRVEPGILNYIQFLKETTPYSAASEKIDPILSDPAASYFLVNLKRNGEDISNLTVYILSPSTHRLLEWSSDF